MALDTPTIHVDAWDWNPFATARSVRHAQRMDMKESSPTRAPKAQTAFGSAGSVHAVASRGVAGSGSALPHAAAIQHSFGQHDLSGVRAHLGGAASEANARLGSEAYATGRDIAFAGTPSLHNAAHEAAHIIQQQAGVQLKGGVGEAGDS